MLYLPSVPTTYRTMFTVPNIALTNIMACRVFRKTKLGMHGSNTSFFGPTTTRSTALPGGIPLAFRPTHAPDSDNSHEINVVKSIEHNYDTSDNANNVL